MPKPLPERYIQEVAIEYLAHHYRKCSHNKKIERRLEAYTKAGNRADGVLVWERIPDDVRVISIEAKSATTIHNLLTRWDNEKILISSFYVSLIIVLILFAVAYSYFKMRLAFDVPALVVIFCFVIFCWWFAQNFLPKVFPRIFRTAGVLTQAAKYPGNEVWIAIGVDTFKKNKKERLKALKEQCKRRRFGLIEIQVDNQPPEILLSPLFNRVSKRGLKDFLVYYKNEHVIRKRISGETKNSWYWFTRSNAEWQYQLLHHKIGFALCFLVFCGSFLNFQVNQPKPYGFSLPPISETISPIPHTPVKPIAPKQTPTPLIKDIIKEKPIVTCSLPFKKKGKRIILKDKIVPTVQDAKARVNTLLNVGLKEVNYFWIPCTDYKPSTEAWCVYAYSDRGIKNGKEKILNSQRRYERILKAAGLDRSEMAIWEVEPK